MLAVPVPRVSIFLCKRHRFVSGHEEPELIGARAFGNHLALCGAEAIDAFSCPAFDVVSQEADSLLRVGNQRLFC
jgi:hypothetical protein